MIDGSYSPKRATSSKLLHNTHRLSAQARASPCMVCLWGPPFLICNVTGTFAAGCATPSAPQGCLRHSRPTLGDSGYLPRLSLSCSRPLSHTSLLPFFKHTKPVPTSRPHCVLASAPALPPAFCLLRSRLRCLALA